jgi:2'-hydroxyisoflavone reductase
MQILILGGTRFVGRHIAEAARARGHAVSVFNRGRTPLPWDDVEQLTGDRELGDLTSLAGREWDACIDVSGYLPQHVRVSAGALAGRFARYVFVSTASVYDLTGAPTGAGESSALHPVPEEEVATLSMALYGPLKVACEHEAERAFPGRALIVRPGIVAGPYDPTNRFTWWVERLARGGDVLGPGGPGSPVQVIDARDLAAFAIGQAERAATGVFNACGSPATFGELIEACRIGTDGGASVTWVPEHVLLEHGAEPFDELPLWLPETPEHRAFYSIANSRARAAGLALRPLAETARATWEWLCEVRAGRLPEPITGGFVARGLSPEREAELLAAARA